MFSVWCVMIGASAEEICVHPRLSVVKTIRHVSSPSMVVAGRAALCRRVVRRPTAARP